MDYVFAVSCAAVVVGLGMVLFGALGWI